MTTRSNLDFSLAMRRDERRLKLRSRILFQRPNNVCVKLVIRFLKHDHVTIAPIFSLKKGDVENENRRRKKNNGRVKNTKGVQKEEGCKTFVYDKRNRAITCAFSLVFLAELHARRFAVLGYFWCDFAVIFFSKYDILRFSKSKYAVILNFMTW